MAPFPPIYPEMCNCHRPGRPQQPHSDCRELCPTDVTATVLGVDSCGGIIIRVQRPCCRPEPPCNCNRPVCFSPSRHCGCR